MTPTTRHAGAVLCALALMACSDADPADSPTEPTTAVTDVAALTTRAPLVTTVPASSATTPTTVAAPSTTWNSTTTTTVLSVEDQVVAAYMAAYEAYGDAARRPNDPSLRRAMAEHWAGDPLEFLTRRLDEQVLQSEFLRPSPITPVQVNVESISITGGRAEVVVCTVDSWIRVQTQDSVETVLDDDVVVFREWFVLAESDGRWMVTTAVMLEENARTDGCEV